VQHCRAGEGVSGRQNLSNEKILCRLLALHPKVIELSLNRIERLLEALGSPHLRVPPLVHVAGTNGKGSTIAIMRAILEADGKKVHVYTSPHLVRFNERIRLASPSGGRLVEDGALIGALEACEEANAGEPITFFEITTAAALLLFSEFPADYLLMEVGLGGRADATNVIANPAATIVTPISIDHREFLGTTIESISVEKAGIIKAGAAAILGPQREEALGVLRSVATRIGAPLLVAGEDFNAREERGRLIFEDRCGRLDLPFPNLVGRHQHQNAATAIAALRVLQPDLAAAAVARGLVGVSWPARLERIGNGTLARIAPAGAELWVDGAHNEDGARVVAQAMTDFNDEMPLPLVLVYGTLGTKDPAAFLRRFVGAVHEVITVAIPDEPSSRSASDLATAAGQQGMTATACDGIENALRGLDLRDWPHGLRILITASCTSQAKC
jgi:dihydrofolate synthase/folylpolyglutamate synthase